MRRQDAWNTTADFQDRQTGGGGSASWGRLKINIPLVHFSNIIRYRNGFANIFYHKFALSKRGCVLSASETQKLNITDICFPIKAPAAYIKLCLPCNRPGTKTHRNTNVCFTRQEIKDVRQILTLMMATQIECGESHVADAQFFRSCENNGKTKKEN